MLVGIGPSSIRSMSGFALNLGVAGAWLICGHGAVVDDSARVAQLETVIRKLRPIHKKLGPPRPGDWLDVHDESGETFRAYIRSDPPRPARERRVIYLQPLGDFKKTQRKIVSLTAEFVRHYFGLEVKTNDVLALSEIPARAMRRHPSDGMEQILTTYVLDHLLDPRLPDDAAAYVALTASDLWPGEGWNFVFGEASITQRVGVWSIYRHGDPDKNEAGFRLCLLRTLKTATHEIAHMFSLLHCTAYECNMCGSNSLEESDRGPLALCPECLAKVCWATGCDPVKRYRALAAFCNKHGLSAETAFYEQAIALLDRN